MSLMFVLSILGIEMLLLCRSSVIWLSSKFRKFTFSHWLILYTCTFTAVSEPVRKSCTEGMCYEQLAEELAFNNGSMSSGYDFWSAYMPYFCLLCFVPLLFWRCVSFHLIDLNIVSYTRHSSTCASAELHALYLPGVHLLPTFTHEFISSPPHLILWPHLKGLFPSRHDHESDRAFNFTSVLYNWSGDGLHQVVLCPPREFVLAKYFPLLCLSNNMALYSWKTYFSFQIANVIIST